MGSLHWCFHCSSAHMALECFHDDLHSISTPAPLPRFSGVNPIQWIYQAEQYFQYYSIYDEERFPYIIELFDEDAFCWFNGWFRQFQFVTWQNFTAAMVNKFHLGALDDEPQTDSIVVTSSISPDASQTAENVGEIEAKGDFEAIDDSVRAFVSSDIKITNTIDCSIKSVKEDDSDVDLNSSHLTTDSKHVALNYKDTLGLASTASQLSIGLVPINSSSDGLKLNTYLLLSRVPIQVSYPKPMVTEVCLKYSNNSCIINFFVGSGSHFGRTFVFDRGWIIFAGNSIGTTYLAQCLKPCSQYTHDLTLNADLDSTSSNFIQGLGNRNSFIPILDVFLASTVPVPLAKSSPQVMQLKYPILPQQLVGILIAIELLWTVLDRSIGTTEAIQLQLLSCIMSTQFITTVIPLNPTFVSSARLISGHPLCLASAPAHMFPLLPGTTHPIRVLRVAPFVDVGHYMDKYIYARAIRGTHQPCSNSVVLEILVGDTSPCWKGGTISYVFGMLPEFIVGDLFEHTMPSYMIKYAYPTAISYMVSLKDRQAEIVTLHDATFYLVYRIENEFKGVDVRNGALLFYKNAASVRIKALASSMQVVLTPKLNGFCILYHATYSTVSSSFADQEELPFKTQSLALPVPYKFNMEDDAEVKPQLHLPNTCIYVNMFSFPLYMISDEVLIVVYVSSTGAFFHPCSAEGVGGFCVRYIDQRVEVSNGITMEKYLIMLDEAFQVAAVAFEKILPSSSLIVEIELMDIFQILGVGYCLKEQINIVELVFHQLMQMLGREKFMDANINSVNSSGAEIAWRFIFFEALFLASLKDVVFSHGKTFKPDFEDHHGDSQWAVFFITGQAEVDMPPPYFVWVKISRYKDIKLHDHSNSNLMFNYASDQPVVIVNAIQKYPTIAEVHIFMDGTLFIDTPKGFDQIHYQLMLAGWLRLLFGNDKSQAHRDWVLCRRQFLMKAHNFLSFSGGSSKALLLPYLSSNGQFFVDPVITSMDALYGHKPLEIPCFIDGDSAFSEAHLLERATTLFPNRMRAVTIATWHDIIFIPIIHLEDKVNLNGGSNVMNLLGLVWQPIQVAQHEPIHGNNEGNLSRYNHKMESKRGMKNIRMLMASSSHP